MSEKRKFYRLGAKFSMTCKVVGDEQASHEESISRDISKGGVRFITEGPIKEGSVVSIALTFPDRTESIDFKVKVVWTEPIPPRAEGAPSRGFEHGAEFVLITEEQRELIDQHIALFK